MKNKCSRGLLSNHKAYSKSLILKINTNYQYGVWHNNQLFTPPLFHLCFGFFNFNIDDCNNTVL